MLCQTNERKTHFLVMKRKRKMFPKQLLKKNKIKMQICLISGLTLSLSSS
jgi:hypothetical protein